MMSALRFQWRVKMQNKKKYLSLRFKDANKCEPERISLEEWNEFSGKTSYFKSTDDFLIEAAVNYQRETVDGKTGDDCEYVFAEKEFDKQCTNLIGLSEIKELLKKEFCRLSVHIEDENLSVDINNVDMILSYYPPYILSFDITYQTRVTVDLSLKPNISFQKNTLFVKYMDV